MATAGRELPGGKEMAQPSSQGRAQEDKNKGDVEKIDRDERQACQGPQRRTAQGFFANPQDGLGDDGDHRSGQAVKESGQPRQVSAGHEEPAQGEEDEHRWQDKQRARRHSPAPAMQPPAEVGGQLLGFRAGEQHAEIKGFEEVPVGDPPALLHQFAVHDGDLPGRPAEADATEPEPIAHAFAQGRAGGRGEGVGHEDGKDGPAGHEWHGFYRCAGYFCRGCSRTVALDRPLVHERKVAPSSLTHGPLRFHPCFAPEVP